MAGEFLVAAWENLVPQTRIEPVPWELGIVATGPSGESLDSFFFFFFGFLIDSPELNFSFLVPRLESRRKLRLNEGGSCIPRARKEVCL